MVAHNFLSAGTSPISSVNSASTTSNPLLSMSGWSSSTSGSPSLGSTAEASRGVLADVLKIIVLAGTSSEGDGGVWLLLATSVTSLF